MKKIISVYIIFAFLLMSFAGCGKLKNIVGLSQPQAPALSEVNSQSDTSVSSEVNSQSDTSVSSEVNSQSDTSVSSEVNSQSDTSVSSEVNSQSDTSAPPKANKQFEASPTQLQWLRVFPLKAITQPTSEEERAHRYGKAMDVAAVVLVGIVFTASAIYHTPELFNRRDVDVSSDTSYTQTFDEFMRSAMAEASTLPVFKNPPNSIEVRGSIIRIVGDV